MNIVYPYKHFNPAELIYSLKSLKNYKDAGEVFIIGDSPRNNLTGFTLLEHEPATWAGCSRYHDVTSKIYQYAKTHTGDFLLMNDDFFILTQHRLELLNDDTTYDIIDVYEMYNKWMHQTDDSTKALFKTLPTVDDGYKPKVQSGKMREQQPVERSLSNAQAKVETIRRGGRANQAARSTRNEMDKNVPYMAEHEEQVSEQERSWLQGLRWQGNNSLQEMAKVFRILRRYGSLPTPKKHRQDRQQQGLLKGELQVGYTSGTNAKHTKECLSDTQWSDLMPIGVVEEDWNRCFGFISYGGFSLREVDYTPTNYYRSKLLDGLREGNMTSYKKDQVYMLNWLRRQGLPLLSYELHVPMVINCEKAIETIELMAGTIQFGNILMFRTVYGNMHLTDAEQLNDVKNIADYHGKPLLSTNEQTFEHGEIGKYIRTVLDGGKPVKPKPAPKPVKKEYTIDVLIPVYNQEVLIKKAIESVPKGWNIIVCDDGSTDDTLNVAKTYPHVKVYSNKVNSGIGATKNLLYDKATSDYLVALDSDDYFLPEIENVAEKLDGTDLVFYDLVNNENRLLDCHNSNIERRVGNVKFMRREFLGEHRTNNKRIAEDYHLMMKLYKLQPTMKFTGIVGAHYNSPREGSLSWIRKNALPNQNKEYTIDVLMAVWNQEELVKRAIKSVPKGWNLIVCDDGSTDNTREVVRELAKKRKIKLLWNEKNIGLGNTLNRLYGELKSDYHVQLDSDDYFYPGIKDAAKAIDGTDLVYFDMVNNEGKRWDMANMDIVKYSQSTKFIRNEFFKGIVTDGSNYKEDVSVMKQIVAKNPTVKYTSILGKHYNHPREGSLSWHGRRGQPQEIGIDER